MALTSRWQVVIGGTAPLEPLTCFMAFAPTQKATSFNLSAVKDALEVSTRPGQPHQPTNVSEKVNIKRLNDLTIENVKKLILGAIEEYRNDRDAPGVRISTIT